MHLFVNSRFVITFFLLLKAQGNNAENENANVGVAIVVKF